MCSPTCQAVQLSQESEVSALCKQGAAQGHAAAHGSLTLALDKQTSLGAFNLAFALTIDAAPWYCCVWQLSVTPFSSCGGWGCVNVAAEIRPLLQVTGSEPDGAIVIRDPNTKRVVAMALVIEGESCGQGETGTMPTKQGQHRGLSVPRYSLAQSCTCL